MWIGVGFLCTSFSVNAMEEKVEMNKVIGWDKFLRKMVAININICKRNSFLATTKLRSANFTW